MKTAGIISKAKHGSAGKEDGKDGEQKKPNHRVRGQHQHQFSKIEGNNHPGRRDVRGGGLLVLGLLPTGFPRPRHCRSEPKEGTGRRRKGDPEATHPHLRCSR
jgi:hypothetical protein